MTLRLGFSDAALCKIAINLSMGIVFSVHFTQTSAPGTVRKESPIDFKCVDKAIRLLINRWFFTLQCWNGGYFLPSAESLAISFPN